MHGETRSAEAQGLSSGSWRVSTNSASKSAMHWPSDSAEWRAPGTTWRLAFEKRSRRAGDTAWSGSRSPTRISVGTSATRCPPVRLVRDCRGPASRHTLRSASRLPNRMATTARTPRHRSRPGLCPTAVAAADFATPAPHARSDITAVVRGRCRGTPPVRRRRRRDRLGRTGLSSGGGAAVPPRHLRGWGQR